MSNLPAVREESAFELGKVFAESGMFPNVRKAAEAVVKIIAGREFGLGPMAAMNGIHMVDGKPTLAANLIAGQIKRSNWYDYQVIRRDDTGCELEFFERDRTGATMNTKSLGTMKFEKKDAERAGLLGKQNWKKYPRDMYFARCLTAGARTFCPDVLGGSPIYTAEELGADDVLPSVDTREGRVARGLETPEGNIVALTAEEAVRETTPVITDADVVTDASLVTPDILKQLRATFDASGQTDEQLCWFLLSVGVESLPENPDKAAIGAAMRGLTLEQAFKLDALLKGEDESVPGAS